MPIIFHCPYCKKRGAAKSTWAGRKVNCPHCKLAIFIPGVPEPSPAEVGVSGLPFAPIEEELVPTKVADVQVIEIHQPPDPANRTVLGSLEVPKPPPVVQFFCPKCSSSVSGQAGEKVFCRCGQKLRVPEAPPPMKTILGTIDPNPDSETIAGMPPSNHGQPVIHIHQTVSTPQAPPVPEPPPLYVMPPPPPPPQPRGWQCPHCGSDRRPFLRQEMTSDRWAAVVLLAIFFFPLAWLPLIGQPEILRCSDCNSKL